MAPPSASLPPENPSLSRKNPGLSSLREAGIFWCFSFRMLVGCYLGWHLGCQQKPCKCLTLNSGVRGEGSFSFSLYIEIIYRILPSSHYLSWQPASNATPYTLKQLASVFLGWHFVFLGFKNGSDEVTIITDDYIQ